jgi:formylglycine-generating enzyme required for sulfatase activity
MRSSGWCETLRFRRVSSWVALFVGCAFTSALAAGKSPGARYEDFVLVRGGSFQMGDLWGDSPWAMRETPLHEVQVDDFLLARHETTVGEFARFVKATGYKTVAELDAGFRGNRGYLKDGQLFYASWREHGFKQDPDHPVLLIAWEDAIVYCNWLSRELQLPIAYDEKTGQLLTPEGRPTGDVRQVRGVRLPTEAEWEFAARERGRRVRFGNGQNIARSEEMNFDAAGTGKMIPKLRMRGDNLYPYNEKGVNRGGTTPVSSLRPNALGLYHMSGNAWEWCTDTGGTDYPAEKQVNPCAQGGSSHIIRGGMYDTDATACRASARLDWHPKAWCTGSGFRVALTVDPPESIGPGPETVGLSEETGEAAVTTSEKSARLVYVEAGSFLMGDVFGDGRKWLAETPVHEVEVGSFWIGRHEVTVREFREFIEATGYRTSAEKGEGPYSQTPEETHWLLLPFKQSDDEPVLQMSWNDAANYCNWLSRKAGLPVAYDERTWVLLDGRGQPTGDVRQVRGYRLPTEAEWEFAARERGRKVRFGNGQDVARTSEINFDASSDRYPYAEKGLNRQRSTPVNAFKPNALGLYDMSGNAWEWCTDCAGDYPAERRLNPCIPGDEPRILRGGSMGGDANSVRVFSRACFGRADHCGNSGFRIALTDSP